MHVFASIFCLNNIVLRSRSVVILAFGFWLAIAGCTASNSPNAATTTKGGARPCKVREVMPEYPGGEAAIQKYVSKNLRYPALARQQGVEGKVVVKFMIDSTGTVREAQVTKGIGHGCDEEAVRVITSLGPFKPGMQDCVPIKVYFAMPVNFTLAGSK